jgi:phage gpG-like protein
MEVDLGRLMGYWPPGVSPVVLAIDCDTREATRLLETLAKRHEELGPVAKDVAKILREDLGEQFKQGGDPPWEPLKPSTLAAKMINGLPPKGKNGKVLPRLRQNGGATSVLIATGALRDSYRQSGVRGHVEIIDEKTGAVEVGSQLPVPGGQVSLAAIHQYGTSPYTIVPRVARALRFIGSNGEQVLAKIVHHPGLPARPVRITDNALGKIVTRMKNHLMGSESTVV